MSVAMWWSIYALAAAVTLGVILGVTKFERSCACTDGLCARCDELERAIKRLCALVEQGERDRRRLDWLEHTARLTGSARIQFGVAAFTVDNGHNTLGDECDSARAAIDAAMQPNDSAARTGQEG